jgi:hypothetical protein
MITPEHQIRFAIENAIELFGVKLGTGGSEKLAEKIFKKVFHKMNETALMLLITEIQQKPDDYWNDPPDFYED